MSDMAIALQLLMKDRTDDWFPQMHRMLDCLEKIGCDYWLGLDTDEAREKILSVAMRWADGDSTPERTLRWRKRNNWRRRCYIIEGQVYDTLQQAGLQHGVSDKTVSRRVKSDRWPEWALV